MTLPNWLADLAKAPCPPRVTLAEEGGPAPSAEVQQLMASARAEYDAAPVCPHCGDRKGFSRGTGDCGCTGDDE